MVGDDECEDILKDRGATYWRDKGESWGRRLNFMYPHTTEPYLFCGADDVWFHVAGSERPCAPWAPCTGSSSSTTC